MLRSEHEAEGGEAPAVVRLTLRRSVVEGIRIRDGDGRRLAGGAIGVVDGRIAAIGMSAAVRRVVGGSAERVVFRDATVLPGLVDPHVHVAGMAAREVELDVRAARSVAEVLRAVRAAARRASPDEWIRGGGVDETRLGRLPTAAELGRAAEGRPVRLRHRSRHASVLSTAALARLGGRVPGGALAAQGLVVGRERAIAEVLGPLADAALVRGLRVVSAGLAARGVTCVGDASPRSARASRRLADLLRTAGFAPRVVGMGTPTGALWRPDDRLPCAGVKIVVEDDPGGMRPRPETLRRLIRTAACRGLRVAVHCVTLGTLVATLEAFAAVPARHRRGRGHRLEHVGECPPALVAEIARLGLAVVTNPSFVYWRGDVYLAEREVPPSWLYRAGTFARAGVEVAGASDAPVTPCDPWATMAAARARRTRGGAVLGARERVGARAALALVCRAAATVAGRRELGRLAVGGPADLTVVDRDPIGSTPEEVCATRVLLTMVGGETAWRA